MELLFLFILIIILLFIYHIRRRQSHPPGPLGVPFYGMLPFRFVELILSKWIKSTSDAARFESYKRKYGAMWSVEIGKKRIVTLASWKLINEAFLENAKLFSGRSKHSAYTVLYHGRGIIFTDGEIWRGHRKLAIRALKELGMGSRDLESRIHNEAEDLILYLDKNSADPLNMINVLSKGVSNVVTRLVFSEVNDYEDPYFDNYIKHLRDIAHSDISSKKISIFPFFFQTFLAKKLFSDINKFFKDYEYCYKFIENKCSMRAKMIEKDVPPDCVFDYFYKFRFLECTAKEEEKEIVQAMSDLFNAGIDTTSNLLSFCCLFLGKYQDLQNNLRKEINELVEDGRNLSLSMRKNCPRLLSFIDEVHRVCSIIPKVHHRIISNCVFNGYPLYEDDLIFADLVNVHLDATLFRNPKIFNASRFIDESTGKYSPSKYLIPFGIGKRSCLGESIATMETFIFLKKIIQTFAITLPKVTHDNIDQIIEGHSGLVHAPLDHFICLSKIEPSTND